MMVDLPFYGPTNRIRLGSFLRFRPLLLNYTGGEKLSDFQVKCILTSSDIPFEKLRADKQDLLFIDNNNELIPYWIEEATDSKIILWLKFTEIIPGETVFWLYYGCGNFRGFGNAALVFDFFDDFSGDDLDTEKWGVEDAGGNGWHSISGSTLRVVHPDHASGGWQGYYAVYLKDGHLFSPPAIIESKIKTMQSTSDGHDDEETVRLEKHDNQSISLLTSFTNYNWRWTLKENQDRTAGLQAYPEGFISGDESYHNMWLIHRVVIDDSQTAKIYFNDSEKGSTTIDWSDSTRIVFHVCRASSGDGDAEMHVDWIRVRKYSEVDPQIII